MPARSLALALIVLAVAVAPACSSSGGPPSEPVRAGPESVAPEAPIASETPKAGDLPPVVTEEGLPPTPDAVAGFPELPDEPAEPEPVPVEPRPKTSEDLGPPPAGTGR